MAIQVRRGLHINLDPNKLLTGEFAVSTDRQIIHVAFAPGVVKRLSTYEDMKNDIEQATAEIARALTASINQATTNANNAATTALTNAQTALTNGNLALSKAQQAQGLIDSVAHLINTDLQATYSDKASLTGNPITCPNADDGVIELLGLSAPSVQVITEGGNSSGGVKNLLPSTNNPNQVINGITFNVNSDKSITINGTATATADFYLFGASGGTTPIALTLPVNTAYTIGGTGHNNVSYQIGSGTSTTLTTSSASKTFAIAYQTTYVWALIRVTSGTTLSNHIVKPQIELGSTATAYEQFGVSFTGSSPSPDYPSPIVVPSEVKLVSKNINLLPNEAVNIIHNGITFTVNADKSITISGTATNNATLSLMGKYNNDKSIFFAPSGFSYKVSGGFNSSIFLITQALDGTYHPIHNASQQSGWIGKHLGQIYIQVINGATVNTTIYPQIEFGTVVTPYTPPKSNEITISKEFGDLPNGTKNTIELINGKLKHIQRIGKAIFDGSTDEPWAIPETLVDTLRITHSTAFSNAKDDNILNMVCDRFTCTLTDDAKDYEHLRKPSVGYPATLVIYINKTRLSTLDIVGVRAWLTSNPVTVYYELATPIITDLTEDIRYALKSYKGETNLFATNDAVMEVNFKSELWSRDYLQDVEIGMSLDGLASKINKTDIVSNDITGGTDKVASAEVVKVLGGEIDTINSVLGIQSGSFTPTIYGTTTSGTSAYSSRNGTYYKIGKLCYVYIRIVLSSKGGATGRLTIGGLPLTSMGIANQALSISVFNGFTFTRKQLTLFVLSGAREIQGLWVTDSGGIVALDMSDVSDTAEIVLSGTYLLP